MRKATYVKNIAIFLASLIIMLPVAFADTINLFYDENGNVIQENINGNPHIKREYNGLNQLVAVRNATNNNYIEKYTHHPLQERIWIKEVYNSSGSLKETVYYLSKEFVRTVNASSGQVKDYTYVWMDGQLVAQVNPDNSTYYILGDHLGSTTIVTNSSGAVIENTSYNPDGDFIEGGDTSRYGYEGKEKSSVLGDIDFYFRKYDPNIRIFLQPDDRIPNPYNPQYLNRYMFELGNPYRYTDPTGHYTDPYTSIGQGVASYLKGVVLYIKYTSLIGQAKSENLKIYYTEQRTKVVRGYFNQGTAFVYTGTSGQGKIETLPKVYVEMPEYYETPPSWDDFNEDKKLLEKENLNKDSPITSSNILSDTLDSSLTSQSTTSSMESATLTTTYSSGGSSGSYRSYLSSISGSRVSNYAKKYGFSYQAARRKLAKAAAYRTSKSRSKK